MAEAQADAFIDAQAAAQADIKNCKDKIKQSYCSFYKNVRDVKPDRETLKNSFTTFMGNVDSALQEGCFRDSENDREPRKLKALTRRGRQPWQHVHATRRIRFNGIQERPLSQDQPEEEDAVKITKLQQEVAEAEASLARTLAEKKATENAVAAERAAILKREAAAPAGAREAAAQAAQAAREAAAREAAAQQAARLAQAAQQAEAERLAQAAREAEATREAAAQQDAREAAAAQQAAREAEATREAAQQAAQAAQAQAAAAQAAQQAQSKAQSQASQAKTQAKVQQLAAAQGAAEEEPAKTTANLESQQPAAGITGLKLHDDELQLIQTPSINLPIKYLQEKAGILTKLIKNSQEVEKNETELRITTDILSKKNFIRQDSSRLNKEDLNKKIQYLNALLALNPNPKIAKQLQDNLASTRDVLSIKQLSEQAAAPKVDSQRAQAAAAANVLEITVDKMTNQELEEKIADLDKKIKKEENLTKKARFIRLKEAANKELQKRIPTIEHLASAVENRKKQVSLVETSRLGAVNASEESGDLSSKQLKSTLLGSNSNSGFLKSLQSSTRDTIPESSNSKLDSVQLQSAKRLFL
jgi:hypothetical protein